MRYHKQFDRWPNIYLLALLAGGACLGLTISMDELRHTFGMTVCTLFLFLIAWILRKGRGHYLDIDTENIIHHGFKHWSVRKADVAGVEHGRKGWIDDRDPYLTVRTGTGDYSVDGGFLLDEQRVEELAQAMRNTNAPPHSTTTRAS
jgi:hypothetical protein